MKNISKTALASAASGTLLLVAPLAAFAQSVSVSADADTNTSVTAPAPAVNSSAYAGLRARLGAHASSTMARPDGMKGMHMGSSTWNGQKGSGQGFANRQQNAGTMIDNRIAAMQKAEARIDAAVKLSADEKADLKASIDNVISQLTALKAQIGTDTSTTTLKADAGSITKAYRVYMLVLPQAAIASASDRALAIITQMSALETKLEARISAAQSAGTDVSAMNTALSDFKAKVADAQSNANAAAAEVKDLSADNGDQATASANTSALKDARAKLETARQDLKTAYADAKTIAGDVKGKKGADGSVSASTTAQ